MSTRLCLPPVLGGVCCGVCCGVFPVLSDLQLVGGVLVTSWGCGVVVGWAGEREEGRGGGGTSVRGYDAVISWPSFRMGPRSRMGRRRTARSSVATARLKDRCPRGLSRNRNVASPTHLDRLVSRPPSPTSPRLYECLYREGRGKSSGWFGEEKSCGPQLYSDSSAR